MNLAPGERPLLTSDSGEFVLTSHKARFASSGRSGGEVVSIMLESVTSCRMVHTSKPWLLGVSLFAVLVGILGMGNGGGWVVIWSIVALVAALLYLSSRRQVIAITSPTAEIKLDTRGMSVTAATAFIDRLEAAKAERLEALRREPYA